MSRFKKFLYAYFTIILLMIVLSALGFKVTGGELSLFEYFLSSPLAFGGTTLAVFIASLFL